MRKKPSEHRATMDRLRHGNFEVYEAIKAIAQCLYDGLEGVPDTGGVGAESHHMVESLQRRLDQQFGRRRRSGPRPEGGHHDQRERTDQ